jgi:PAS domain S-box-containing protein
MSKNSQIEKRGDDRFAAIFDQVSDGIFVADSTTGKFIEINRPGCRMFGYSREEIIGADIGLLSSGIHPYTQAMAIEHNREAQARRNGGHIGEIEPFEWQAKTKDGKLFWVEMSLRPTEFSHAPATVAVVRDITERKKLNDRIAFMAEHDPLTGLPNRLKFTAALERQIEQSKRSGRGFFVMFLDLDRFKEVNDGRGHPVGDELLRLVAARLLGRAPARDRRPFRRRRIRDPDRRQSEARRSGGSRPAPDCGNRRAFPHRRV